MAAVRSEPSVLLCDVLLPNLVSPRALVSARARESQPVLINWEARGVPDVSVDQFRTCRKHRFRRHGV